MRNLTARNTGKRSFLSPEAILTVESTITYDELENEMVELSAGGLGVKPRF